MRSTLTLIAVLFAMCFPPKNSALYRGGQTPPRNATILGARNKYLTAQQSAQSRAGYRGFPVGDPAKVARENNGSTCRGDNYVPPENHIYFIYYSSYVGDEELETTNPFLFLGPPNNAVYNMTSFVGGANGNYFGSPSGLFGLIGFNYTSTEERQVSLEYDKDGIAQPSQYFTVPAAPTGGFYSFSFTLE